MMDLTPFNLSFSHGNTFQSVQVRPCCREDEVIYYDIWMNNLYQYTITQGLINEDKPGWRVALQNADKVVDQGMVQTIGVEIESHFL